WPTNDHPEPLSGPKTPEEASVSQIPVEKLRKGIPRTQDGRPRALAGKKTLYDKNPIEPGPQNYRLVMDYTNKDQNRLYVIDTRDDSIVARYISNGGVNGTTGGGKTVHQIDKVEYRPTWHPTKSELAQAAFVPDGPGPTGSMGVLKLHF